jgi:hypothetical protein
MVIAIDNRIDKRKVSSCAADGLFCKKVNKNHTTKQMLKKGRYGNEFYVQFRYEGFSVDTNGDQN